MKRIALLLLITIATVGTSCAQDKKVYDPKANARADIDGAVAKARKEGKHVLVQVGGNWCGWCIAFHKMAENTPALKQFINDNYEVVLVNYSAENKNEAVLASLNFPQRFGFPVFVILDGNGKLLHTQNSSYLETDEKDANGKKKTGHSVKAVTDFLKNWTAKAVDPATYKEQKTK
ncbi:thioredoxin family protein [Pedobacter sp. B4-66]|uniref:thioredoxin family protein n=1 Tax=Pedobacter sp. B4-66 TaxID=2817280 RepID=UPI001BDAFA19|nr:thioredoxin family protein [Pedobacter sp. B4-66]